MRKILEDQRIEAQDQNKVFFERASARRLSPSDATRKYRLRRGKANACVEFDVREMELMFRWNALVRTDEYFIVGDVDLRDRNPQGFINF